MANKSLHYLRCDGCSAILLVECRDDGLCSRKRAKCPACPAGQLRDEGTAVLVVNA